MAKLSIRVDLAPLGAVGPGKIRLLEFVDETGSISAAGRAMNMSYRRAWLLIDELNRLFKSPLVAARTGGEAGGGAELTPLHLRAFQVAVAGGRTRLPARKSARDPHDG
jgi:molybdate transport system regulatory protein